MISLSQASKIVDEALKKARALNLPPMTVAVLDAHGCLVAFKREDHSSLLREEIAKGKAWGALGMGVGTRSLSEAAKQTPEFYAALSALSGGRVIPVPGGVLVREESGKIIGSVGVSGDVPDNDESCAQAGIKAVGLIYEDLVADQKAADIHNPRLNTPIMQ